MAGSTDRPEVLGRDEEIRAIERFARQTLAGSTVLLIEGETGIGKTALWQAAIEACRGIGIRVLISRPSQADADLPLGVVSDLLGPVLDDVLPILPEPQARALAVALHRSTGDGPPPEPLAVSLAFLAALRALSSTPTVVAIDDAQWIDPSSTRILAYALRRLADEPVGALFAATPNGWETELMAELPEDRATRLRLSSLSRSALDAVLAGRLGSIVPPALVRRIHAASGGNPAFGLEIGKAMLRVGRWPEEAEPLPVPDTLRDLVRARVSALTPEARQAVLVTSLASRPTPERLRRLVDDPSGVDEALDAGALAAADQGGRVWLIHPFVGPMLQAEAPPEELRRLHGRMAELAEEAEERARHLALAAEGPDLAVAAALDEAATRARSRGAPDAAAGLLELASRLTPSDAGDDRRARLARAADYHFQAGDADRARALLEQLVRSSAPGRARADLLRRTGWLRYHEGDYQAAATDFEDALAEASEDETLRALIERDLAFAGLTYGDFEAAGRHARTALELAERAGEPRAVAEALTAVGLSEAVLGQGVRIDVLERAIELEAEAHARRDTVQASRTAGRLLKWAGDAGAATARFEALRARAVERGDTSALPGILHNLGELACRAGDLERAAKYAREGYEAATRSGQVAAQALLMSTRGMVEAHLGRIEEARELARRGVELSEQSGVALASMENRAVLGFVELSTGNFAGAHRELGPLVEQAAAMRLVGPFGLGFLADEAEALVALGQLSEAEAVIARLRGSVDPAGRSWAIAAAGRCTGFLAGARGKLPVALKALEQARVGHEALGEPMELGRTLLALGSAQRRAKQRAAARRTLDRARGIFDALPAPLWSLRAREELSRTTHRAMGPRELTETERRVAELVAAGRSNSEVARRLFITVRTVEANLTRVYQKLGLRSRTELASKFAQMFGPSERIGERR